MINTAYFYPPPTANEIPACFPSPFDHIPHLLAQRASNELQERLNKLSKQQYDFFASGGGKMFGVLVVKDTENQVGFLSACSGTSDFNRILRGFVPPVFDSKNSDQFVNSLGEKKSLAELFEGKRLPDGIGECAATKLVQFVVKNQLMPLAMAEFWWGASPPDKIRHHGQFYPACRGKCRPVLPFLLKRYDVAPPPPLGQYTNDDEAPEVIYEDEHLVVVNKPHGLLSVPGKEIHDSVLTRLQKRYPEATGPLLLHRLDLSTSGLLLAAKTSEVHKALQQQFQQRTIEKRYVAVLSKVLPENQNQGTIELPLRVDLDDRPRQLVCSAYGKHAKTHWEVIARDNNSTRVYFYPVTGRTHQLRIHAAHKNGLNAPIEGDELYGDGKGRLKLHAERLCFTHPITSECVDVQADVPF